MMKLDALLTKGQSHGLKHLPLGSGTGLVVPQTHKRRTVVEKLIDFLWYFIPTFIKRKSVILCGKDRRCLVVFKKYFMLALSRRGFILWRPMMWCCSLVLSACEGLWNATKRCFGYLFNVSKRTNDSGYDLLPQYIDEYDRTKTSDLIISLNQQLQESKDDKIQALRDKNAEISALKVKLQALEKAKDEALSRLSEHVSLKLNDNNPNIADLSDINRPTNLAEKFSTLYDDEWTEAFESLSKKPEFGEEAKAIEFLLKIVKECFNVCREESCNQLQKLLDAYKSTVDAAPKELVKLNKDIRKKYADVYFQEVLQKICSDLKTSYEEIMQDAAIQAFVNRCTELCWLMAVQDPPMSLFSDVSSDRLFDKTKYRDYMKSGKYVEFVVWPCVLIQDGGSLMSKGIAQGQPTLATETIVNMDE